jgi:sugar lactone lactonase YvrE
VVVLARHLDTPRGVALGRDGTTVYVAEAGHGPRRCARDFCVAFTGAVARYRPGGTTRVARGLLTLAADPSFHNVRGLDAVSVAPDGDLYGVVGGLANVPAAAVSDRVRAQAGRVVLIRRGAKRFGPRLGGLERSRNPDGGEVETDPYGLVATDATRFVADAGGNDVLRADHGRVALVAVIPRAGRTFESVPTAIARTPGGALLVGEFTGAGRGGARVWRVAPGRAPTVFARGLTQITGLALGPDGSVYVTEGSTDGAFGRSHGDVVRIRPGGRRTRYGAGRLVAPAGAAVDRRGRIYVSNHSTRTAAYDGGGELVRLDP